MYEFHRNRHLSLYLSSIRKKKDTSPLPWALHFLAFRSLVRETLSGVPFPKALLANIASSVICNIVQQFFVKLCGWNLELQPLTTVV